MRLRQTHPRFPIRVHKSTAQPQTKMAITTKAHLLDEIHHQRASLEVVLDRVPPDRQSQPLADDGWSVKDILAHIVAWEQVMMQWWQASQAGETPIDPAPGLSDDDVERLNAAFYQANRQRPLAEVQDEFHRSFAEVMAALEAASEAALVQPGYFAWTGERPFAAYIVANTSDHYREHLDQIHAWAEAVA